MFLDYFEARRREMERRVMLENVGRIAAGAAMGAALGTALGVLLAPKSGVETRRDIANKAYEVGGAVRSGAERLSYNAMDLAGKVKNNVQRRINRIKNEVEEVEAELIESEVGAQREEETVE